MFDRNNNSLGTRLWDIFLRPRGIDLKKKKSSFSKPRHMLGRTGNYLGPGPLKKASDHENLTFPTTWDRSYPSKATVDLVSW